MEPYALNTSQIRMVATTATDSGTPPVAYYHDFTGSPTGGSGGTDSGWSSLASYIDSGLQANHQYCYRVRARDSVPSSNTTNYSTTKCIYTGGNDSDGDGVPNNVDNCPATPNGPGGGTCSAGTIGDPCMTNGNCGCLGECSMDQEDADSDGLGDVCDSCPEVPNGPARGSCFNYFTHEVWGECLDDGSCQDGSGQWYKWCDTFQGDGDSDGTGDVCDPTP
ncbi:MAG: thrombospondin type 3 repeat-containing protein [Deltaproteobacteria bacterium]|nr:thrombospondin type 3 repeat-containing protein [Deltaproteobacteria bacterium]